MSLRPSCAHAGGQDGGELRAAATGLGLAADSGWKKPASHRRTDSGASTGSREGHETGQFDCNICLDMAYDPVVTVCGHLYCWPCIYKWLRQQEGGQLCPVCKAAVSRDKIIPIYGRGRPQIDPRSRSVSMPVALKAAAEDVPDRPAAQRPVPAQDHHAHTRPAVERPLLEADRGAIPMPFNLWATAPRPVPALNAAQAGAVPTLTAGLSFLPTFFGLPFNIAVEQGGAGATELSPEQERQAVLSRLLLLLGSMVILCLLLF